MMVISNRFTQRFSLLKPSFLLVCAICSSSIFAQSKADTLKKKLDLAVIHQVAQVVADSFGAPVNLVEEFIREAKEMEQEEGIPATAFIGIAILESTGFTSYLYQHAKNPFGMRATKIWSGATFVMWHEGADAPFRKYNSPREAVRDFAAFLNSRKWFQDAFSCPTTDLECFLNALSSNKLKKEPGYAADPEWPNKVRRVIRNYGLERLR